METKEKEMQENNRFENWLERWRESQIGTACIWLFYTIFLALFLYGIVFPFFGVLILLYVMGLSCCWPCCCAYYIIKRPDLIKESANKWIKKE